ncbi:MAG: M48 family metallopeptidase [Bryobacteraceae bacterium]
MPRRALYILCCMAVSSALMAQPKPPRPGFNLFSKDQDVQLGREAATEVEKQYTVVKDSQLNAYITRIGKKLAAQPEAGDYPYTFKVVSDDTINAFALPGGPTFINTGLIAAADNESQLAGVMAHEISHVALRHGTNQASKANLIQLPTMLAGNLAGKSLAGQLAQLGIGFGANSVLLKYSRNAERDADLLGTRILNGAGYNPVEMARFFEKLNAESGSTRTMQFFSSHPNPGNRVKAVEDLIQYLPPRKYSQGSASELARMKQIVAKLPKPPVKK